MMLVAGCFSIKNHSVCLITSGSEGCTPDDISDWMF